MALHPGDSMEVRFTKWGGKRHWEFALTVLGVDEHGVWGAAPVGTHLWRPDAHFDSGHDWVTLVPHQAPWAASFYDSAEQHISVYVDMSTPAEWSGATVSMVDLDLDVVLDRNGDLFVDDEDEFQRHQVSLGYPADVVDLARRTADEVLAAIAERAEPFATTGHAWLQRWRAA